ncbi:MAG: acyl carrier protein [Opitutaceae bacterium]|nr:acyl carrier protein [Cytophagales bacterium]
MANSIINSLSEIFKEVLDIQDYALQAETTPNDIPEWDSVNHLILLHAIEEHYKIKFDLAEMINFRNVGDICESIIRKTA